MIKNLLLFLREEKYWLLSSSTGTEDEKTLRSTPPSLLSSVHWSHFSFSTPWGRWKWPCWPK